MRVLAIAFVMTLALLAAPAPFAVESVDACAGSGCPVGVEECRPWGYEIWVLGKKVHQICLLGPTP